MKGSGRTVGKSRGHRPWFGRQQAKKRRQGMPPINKGTNASRVLASQRHHPLQSVSGAVGIVYELPKKGRCSLSTQMVAWGSATGRSVVSSTQATTDPSCDGLKVTSLPTAALCSHGVELLPILQNLSIDVHQNIVCFLNKLFPTPFVRHPSSCIHQSDVLIFKRHNLQSVG